MNNDRLPSLAVPPLVALSEFSSPRVSSIGSSIGFHEGSSSSFSSAPSSHGPKTPSPTFPLNAITAPSTTISSYDAMNHSATDMYYSQSMSAGQQAPPQTVTSSTMSHYSQQQPPLLQPGPYHNQGSYPPYGYPSGLTSPPGAPPSVSSLSAPQTVLPLPGVNGSQSSLTPQYTTYDTTGQQPPHGMKPRVTATLWEDEGSLCFQVEARGICVARREDNHMINGTKLLNVAGMTRGRRDGILKSEKIRHVVKIGPMHLKGVWIPYDRALEFANKEKITELLYPLFVHNIGALLYHPSNQNRTTQVMAAAERRKQDQGQMRTPAPGLPSIQQHGLPGSQPSLPSHSNMGRPPLDRAHTFPTPPASTSNVMGGGGMGHSENFGWQGQGMGGAQGNNPLPLDGALNTRSMPTTPATTPPGPGGVPNMSYPAGSQSYDGSRHMYSASASHPSPYPSASHNTQDRMYGQAGAYPKQEMGPPLTRPSTTGGSGDQHDIKSSNGIIPEGPGSQPHHGPDEEGDNDAEYTHDSNTYDTPRNSFNYAAPGVGGSSAHESHISAEMSASPHPPGSGRATPRTTAPPQSYYSNQNGSYSTPPRTQQSSSNPYNIVTNDRPAPNGVSGNDGYAHNPELSANMPNGYPSQHASYGAGKRSRGEEEDDVPRGVSEMDHKRRKTLESSMPAPAFDAMNRPTSTVSIPHRR